MFYTGKWIILFAISRSNQPSCDWRKSNIGNLKTGNNISEKIGNRVKGHTPVHHSHFDSDINLYILFYEGNFHTSNLYKIQKKLLIAYFHERSMLTIKDIFSVVCTLKKNRKNWRFVTIFFLSKMKLFRSGNKWNYSEDNRVFFIHWELVNFPIVLTKRMK